MDTPRTESAQLRRGIEALSPVDEDTYRDVDLNHLVMYAVAQVDRIGAELCYENVVVAAYRLFPRKFSLPAYPHYPDGKRVHDALFRCTFRANQWLDGKTAHGFRITDRSRAFIREAEDLLAGKVAKRRPAPSKSRRKEAALADLLSSNAYSRYVEGAYSSISEADFCFLMQGTLDSSSETLSHNLAVLTRFAEELGDAQAGDFLGWLARRFGPFLRRTAR